MYKLMTRSIILIAVAMLILSACRPPELEGTVLYIKKEQYNDALAQAEEAIKKYPDQSEAWFYYGWLSAEMNNDYATMNEAFDKALGLAPQKVEYKGGKVDSKSAIEDYRGKLFTDNFNEAIKLIPEANELEGEARKKKLMMAKEKLDIAHRSSPDRVEPYRPMALANLFLGDTTAATTILEDGLKKNPDSEDLVTVAGEVYSIAGNTDRAVELYKKALTLNDQNVVVYQRLGNIESKRKNWEEAKKHFEKAIELDPSNKDVAFNIGVSYYNQGQLQDAIPFFQKTIEADPDDEAVYEILGRTYAAAEEYEAGKGFLESAVQKFPENADLWEFLAITYGQLGQSDKSSEAFNKSKALKGN